MADADLVLGYLSPERFCSGRVPLHPERACAAILEHVAKPRGVSIEEAALGVLNVCVTNMVGAVRNITMERGHDPRDFTLVAFGGAGPVHATFVAAELGIPEVLVLRDPGLLSAKGLLLTDYRCDAFRTLAQRLEDVDVSDVNQRLTEMEGEALGQLPAGAAAGRSRIRRIAELCYEAQQNPIPVELEHFPLETGHLPGLAAALERKFQATFGFAPQNRKPQLLHLRVLVEQKTSAGDIHDPSRPVAGRSPAPREKRAALFPGGGARPVEVGVYHRDDLGAGAELPGPVIIEEDYSNTVVGPGQTARVDDHGNILVRIGEA
jgi:N-methylhydantoinase A